MDNPGEQSSESELGSDENYDDQEEMKQMGSEVESEEDSGGSDFSGSESNAESSSVKTDSEEEVEGMDWDEMERKTIETENKRKQMLMAEARHAQMRNKHR